MKLVETHIIKPSDKRYDEADNLCFLSKNLYNASNYAIRQHFFKTGSYLSYASLNKMFTDDNQVDYRSLPAKVSKGTQRKLDKNWKSYFKASVDYQKHPEKYTGRPRIPKYLDKSGRYLVHYEKGALSFKRKGYIKLSKTNIYIKTNISVDDVLFVDIVHSGHHIKFLVGYYQEISDVMQNDEHRYASIDLGINNLMTVTSNVVAPVIFNGKPVKSINQYANKMNSKFTSLKAEAVNNKDNEKVDYYDKKLQKLWLKRNNKINDYMHKSSNMLVNHLVSNEISLLVIGKNEFWKQDSNIGKQNNQNFVSIPYNRLLQMIEYKCLLKGIAVVYTEESYTSKASFLDNDDIPVYQKGSDETHNFSGKRACRGLYRTKNNKYINADVNGSLNILKKYLSKNEAWNNQLWLDCVERCSNVTIRKISIV